MWNALRDLSGIPQEVQLVAQQPQLPFILPFAAFGVFLKHYLHCDTERDDDHREMLLAVRLMSVNREYREMVITFVQAKCKLSVEHFINRFADRLMDLEDHSCLYHSPSDLMGFLTLRVNLTFAHEFDGVETSEAVATLLRRVYEKMYNRLTPSVALATVHTRENSFEGVMKDATEYNTHTVVAALIRAAKDLDENPLALLIGYTQRTFDPYYRRQPPYQDPSVRDGYYAIEEFAATHPDAACPKNVCLVNMLCCAAGSSDEEPWLYPKIEMLIKNGYYPKIPGELAIHLLESGQVKAAAFIASRFCSQTLQTTLWRKVLESPNNEHLAQILGDEGVTWVETASNALNAMAKISSTHPTNASKFRRAILTAKKVIGTDKCFKSLHPKRKSYFTPMVKMIIEDCLRK